MHPLNQVNGFPPAATPRPNRVQPPGHVSAGDPTALTVTTSSPHHRPSARSQRRRVRASWFAPRGRGGNAGPGQCRLRIRHHPQHYNYRHNLNADISGGIVKSVERACR